MNIPQLTSLLTGGENISGCQRSVSDAVALANLHFPSRAYCLVADWAILDIEVTTRQLKAITDNGLVPALVYALTVIQDSKGRFLPGDWVKTTLAVSYSEGCLFETRNTIYVLMGSGRRLDRGWNLYMEFVEICLRTYGSLYSKS